MPTYFSSSTKSCGENIPQNSVNMAYALSQKGKVNEAIKVLNEALENGSDDFEAYFYRGVFYEKIKEYDKALHDFEESVALNPNYYESYRHIDWHYTRQQRFEKVIDFWDIFLDQNPEHANAYLERGGAYYHLNNMEKAMDDAEKACAFGNEEGCFRYKQLQQ
jgi:tetratricopeptide (TPR) repeat protein